MKILVIDLETTGLKGPSQELIVEIGGVILDVATQKISKAFNFLINEGIDEKKHENAWIFDNSSLTLGEVIEKGVKLDDVREILQSYFNLYPTIAYNSNFDFGYLVNRGFEINKNGQIRLDDPMYVSMNILKIPKSWGSPYKWPSVQECLDYFGIKECEPHRAYEDSELEAQIILKLHEIGKYDLNNAKSMVKGDREKAIRYKSKIESYNSTIKECQGKIAKIDENGPEVGPFQTIIQYCEKKIGFCNKFLAKLKV